MDDVTSKPKIKKQIATEQGQLPVHIITTGSLVANIYLRQAPSGYAYYAYNLKRTYQSLTTKNQIHSSDFFAESQADLMAAISQASLWIATQSERSKDTLQNAA